MGIMLVGRGFVITDEEAQQLAANCMDLYRRGNFVFESKQFATCRE